MSAHLFKARFNYRMEWIRVDCSITEVAMGEVIDATWPLVQRRSLDFNLVFIPPALEHLKFSTRAVTEVRSAICETIQLVIASEVIS